MTEIQTIDTGVRNEMPPLPENTIYVCEVGSTSHGTGKDSMEDLDLAGVVVETAEQILGLGHGMRNLMERTAADGERSMAGDIDRTLYSLRSFLKLARNGNPSILMDFYAPIHFITPEGERLRELAPAFVGRHCIERYRGYMFSQGSAFLGMKKGHGLRGSAGRQELIDEYGHDSKYMMHCARLGFQCIELMTTGELKLPIEGEARTWLRGVRYGEISAEEWWDRCLDLDAQMEALQHDESIRPDADVKAIEQFSIQTHLEMWSK